MNLFKKKMCALFLCAFAAIPAAADKLDIDLDQVKKAMEKTYRPFNSEMVFLDVNGEVFIASDNGHYLIRPKTGVVYDLWYNTKIESVSDLEDIPRIHLNKLSMNVDTLNVYEVNPDSKLPLVHIFLDPMGPSNRALFEQIEDLSDDYRFKFILLPGGDPLSVEATTKLACNDSPDTGLKAIMSQEFSKLKPTNNASCQEKVLVQTNMFASILKIRNMPTIVSPEGDVSVGFKGNLASVLTGKKDD